MIIMLSTNTVAYVPFLSILLMTVSLMTEFKLLHYNTKCLLVVIEQLYGGSKWT